MKTIATNDSQNDIYLDKNGNLAVVENLEAIKNISLNMVRTVRGEISLDTLRGIPYFDCVFCAQPNLELFQQYITQEIEQIDNVLSVKDFVTNIDNNKLAYELTIETNLGETKING